MVTDAVVLPSTLDSLRQKLKDFLVWGGGGREKISDVESLTKDLWSIARDSGFEVWFGGRIYCHAQIQQALWQERRRLFLTLEKKFCHL